MLLIMNGPMNAAASLDLFKGYVISMGHISKKLPIEEKIPVFGHELGHVKHLDSWAQTLIQAGARTLHLQSNLLVLWGVYFFVFDKGVRMQELWYITKAWTLITVATVIYQLLALAFGRTLEYLADIAAVKAAGINSRHYLISGILRVGVTTLRVHPMKLMRKTGLSIFATHPDTADRAEAIGVVAEENGEMFFLRDLPVKAA